jgi:hypothetical protein
MCTMPCIETSAYFTIYFKGKYGKKTEKRAELAKTLSKLRTKK